MLISIISAHVWVLPPSSAPRWESPGIALEREAKLKAFMAGDTTDFDLAFTVKRSIPLDYRLTEEELRNALPQGAEVQITMFNEETQVSRYEVRRGPDKLWLRRHYGEAGFSDALSPLHAAAGWASNTFWYLQGSELRIDYNAGRAYRTPLDLLRDHRSSAMAPFTLTVMKAMHFGVPTHPGQLQWDGRGFSATNSAHARISGVLVCGSAGPERLVFDRILTSGGQETIVHTRATLRYREPQGLYPVGVRIEHESVSAGRPPSRWEEEFTDVQVAVEPSRPEGSFAPEGFIDAYADSIQVRVRSNQWHYIAFMNGAWLESPIFLEMDRRGVASPRAKSLVRLLFLAVLLLPLAVLVRHRSARNTRPQ